MQGERDGPTKVIRDALEKVGIPRAIFQIVQLTGLIESIVTTTIKYMVRSGEIEVMPISINKPPKMYRLAIEKSPKIHENKTKSFALEMEDKYRGFRWWKIKRSGEWN